MIVVDASVLVEALLGQDAAIERLADEELAAPHLVDAEVGSALRRMTSARDISELRAGRALGRLVSLEIIRYPHTYFVQRAWELRANATIYDAIYLALAEALDVPFVTLDAALAGVPGSRSRVEVLGSA